MKRDTRQIRRRAAKVGPHGEPRRLRSPAAFLALSLYQDGF